MNKETAIEVMQPEARAVSTMKNVAPLDFESLMRYAIEKNVGADTIKELMGIRRELNEEASKKAFDEALSAFQAECPVITKERGVPTATGKIAYRFAPIESIEIQIRPLLRKYGFSHTFDTDVTSVEGWVIAKCIVTHAAGHCRTSTVKFPLGTKTNIMSETQQYAAALTFACRRALSNAYGLVLGSEDIDGATGKIKPTGPSKLQPENPSVRELAAQLWKILEPVRGTARNWTEANNWLWREEILDGAVPETAPQLTEKRFKEVIEAAKKKLA